MLSSAVVALAVLASAGPVLSVPITTFTPEARNADVELVEREPFLAPSTAFNNHGILSRPLSKIPVHPLFNPADLFSIKQREELVELLARADADADADESGASLFSTAFKVLSKFIRKRDLDARDADELLELFARADEDESGASILSSAFKFFNKLFRKRDLDARDADELLELFARADADADESGASLFSTAFKIFNKLFRKRDLDARDADELLELFARADEDESGASLLSSAFKIFNKFFRKRDLDARDADELLQLFARDEESGSLIANLKPFISVPINRFPPSTGRVGPHIFGLETIHARDADSDSDSGALNILGFNHFPVFNKVPVSLEPVNRFPALNTFSVGGLHTRELLELLARADLDDDSSEAFSFSSLKNIGKIALNLGGILGNLIPSHSAPPPPPPPAQTGTPPVQQRDLLEVLARADDDESGASIFTTLKGIFNDAEKLKKVATVTGIASDGASIVGAL